MVEIKRK